MDLTQEAIGSHQQMLRGHCSGFHHCLKWVLFCQHQLLYQPFTKDEHTWAEPADRLCPGHCVHLLAFGCLQSCRRRTASSGLSGGISLLSVPQDKCGHRGRLAEDPSSPYPPSDTGASAGPELTTLGLRTGSVCYCFLSQGRVPISWGGGRSWRQRDCILQLKASFSSLL